MHDLLRQLCARHRPAVLLVTHDVDEAVTLADRVAELERDLIATTPQRRHRRFDAGNELRIAKFRLERIEECIAGIAEKYGR